MSRRVWKFPLPLRGGVLHADMPAGARIVHVALQDGAAKCWALVDPHAEPVPRTFVIRGTGEPVGGGESYIGTVFTGPLVLHVFEVFA